jgi:hypothetical protein
MKRFVSRLNETNNQVGFLVLELERIIRVTREVIKIVQTAINEAVTKRDNLSGANSWLPKCRFFPSNNSQILDEYEAYLRYLHRNRENLKRLVALMEAECRL